MKVLKPETMTKEQLQEMHGWLLQKIAESSAEESQKTILEARLNGSKKQFEMGMLDGEEFSRVLAQIEKEVKAYPPLDIVAEIGKIAVALKSLAVAFDSFAATCESASKLKQRQQKQS